MHTIIPPLKTDIRSSRAVASDFRKPHYDCTEQHGVIHVSVYMPEVDAVGVELVVRGADLIVRGRKRHLVRVNWRALHLEGAQHDYELRLRLGHAFDFDALNAELNDGLLTLAIPRRHHGDSSTSLRKVA